MIRNAWHFCYALRLVFKVVCGSFGIKQNKGQPYLFDVSPSLD
ncbi:DUF3265 domain-containing protein [Shewanella algae]|nr:DUF3265 domain-containing protein [Shewanella algae]